MLSYDELVNKADNIKNEDLEIAKGLYQEALVINPYGTQALTGLGHVYLRQGDTKKADECFNQVKSVVNLDSEENLKKGLLGIIDMMESKRLDRLAGQFVRLPERVKEGLSKHLRDII